MDLGGSLNRYRRVLHDVQLGKYRDGFEIHAEGPADSVDGLMMG